jgi:hypothetical protein
VHRKAFAHGGANRHPRIERGERVLKNDLHVAAHRAKRLALEPADVHAVEPDITARRLDEAENGPAEGGLAAARFAHDA